MELFKRLKQINYKKVLKYLVLILMGAGILNFTRTTLTIGESDYSWILQLVLSFGIAAWMLEEKRK